MSQSLYVAMAGAKQTMLAQMLQSNNLANVNTPGFRADLFNAQSVPVYGDSLPSGVFPSEATPAANLNPGAVVNTGRDLDIAIQGEGWLAVQGQNGGEAYTRMGSLQVGLNGQLQTSTGQLVLGNGGVIALPPTQKILIAKDGTLSIQSQGQSGNNFAVVDRLKLVNPERTALHKGEDGLFYRNDSQEPFEADSQVRVISGAIEGSNVNSVEAMVNIVSLARQFEIEVHMMNQTKEQDQALAQLLQI